MNNTLMLIGYRATGKTTLAQALAERLHLAYCSTDVLVEQELAMSIAQYVAEHGWDAFRTREREVALRLAGTHNAVIDCGGGIVEHADVMERLRMLGPVVWVDADTADIERRLHNDDTRPLLSESSPRRDIEVHYERRRTLYSRYADIYINTSEYGIAECVARLEQQVAGRIRPGGEPHAKG